MSYSENMGAGGAVTIFKSISSLKAVLTSTINELTLRGISESPHLTGEIDLFYLFFFSPINNNNNWPIDRLNNWPITINISHIKHFVMKINPSV